MGDHVPTQQVRFLSTPRGRVAYALVGNGPPLLLPALWISHLEREWEVAEYRAFILALARDRCVVRYDRLGSGLSDRSVAQATTLEDELSTVEALTKQLDTTDLSLLGISWGGCIAVAFAAAHPELVRRLVLFGSYARGDQIAPPPLREALVATVRAHWGAGSRALAEVWIPGADAARRQSFARLQRAAASSELAAQALEVVYGTDVSALTGRVEAPALVLHRRRDRAIPLELGRDLAAALPRGRLTVLGGDLHPPWLGASDLVVRAIANFLSDTEVPRPEPPAVEPVLSTREREVLALVAAGLTDDQIAADLVLSPHTIHRHNANIRLKLEQPSRAAAAAHAARLGII